MHKTIPLAAAALLALAAPAGAACLDQIEQLEGRLAEIEAETGDGARQEATAGGQQQEQQQQPATDEDETVEVTMQDGQEVDVTAEPPGGEDQPQGSWLGGTSSSSVQSAREQLDGARTALEDGNEAGCLEQAAQAERIIGGLEGQ